MKIYPLSLRAHRISAIILLVFIALHITNHLIALNSLESHQAFMETARLVYRSPFIEPIIILAIIIQSITGIIQLRTVWGRWPTIWHKLQIFSGAYLLFFMVNHTIAVLLTLRSIMQLDSNIYAAIAGLHISPLQWFFAPYYTLGIIALFTHIGSFVYFRLNKHKSYRTRIASLTILTGLTASLLIMTTLSGLFYDIELPDNVTKAYKQMIGK